jgi:hypothetical protein
VAEWLEETQAAERFAQWDGEFKRVEAVRYHFDSDRGTSGGISEVSASCADPRA